MLGDHADGTKPHRKRKLFWGQFLPYLLSLISNYKGEVYDCNLVAVIHEITEFYRILISVILLPLLQRLYTPLSAVLNISETCVDLRVTERAKQLNCHTANRSLNKHGPHSESLAWCVGGSGREANLRDRMSQTHCRI